MRLLALAAPRPQITLFQSRKQAAEAQTPRKSRLAMQNDFVSGSLGSEDAKAIVPKVAAFLGKFLEEHGKQGVIFTKDTHGV